MAEKLQIAAFLTTNPKETLSNVASIFSKAYLSDKKVQVKCPQDVHKSYRSPNLNQSQITA